MDIAIFSNGLEHAETTIEHRSLGGSEAAALMVAKDLARRGHCVTMFSRLPSPTKPDHIASGTVGADGVRYCAIEEYQAAITGATWDLLIVSRDPSALSIPHQANKAVLWLHDLATAPFVEVFTSIAWNVDEVWAVSEFHRQQIHGMTDFDLSKIHAIRNGIVEFPEPEEPVDRDPTLLFYGARPERGLLYLVMPGGIMERLPHYRLEFAAYGEMSALPERIQHLYRQLFAWAEALPNVTFLGSLTQAEVRGKLREASALVYPSEFEETSCILAREAISVQCPIIACEIGALPETVGSCGRLVCPRNRPGAFHNDIDFCANFAIEIDTTLGETSLLSDMAEACAERTDLDWAGVGEMVETIAKQRPERPVLASAKALVEVGDVIPAMSLLTENEGQAPLADDYLNKLMLQYRRVLGDADEVRKAYADRYAGEPPTYGDLQPVPRFQAIVQLLQRIKDQEAVVLEYGCCEGNQIMNLAVRFPKMRFIGYDHAKETFEHAGALMDKNNISNVEFTDDLGDLDAWPDVVLLTEVLEHVKEPWKLIDEVERIAKPGATIITTTPIGPWEAQRLFSNAKEFAFPEHLWHLDKPAMELMCEGKNGFNMTFVPVNMCEKTMLMMGNLVTWWSTDPDIRTRPIDPLEKAQKYTPRIQTCAACIIAKDEEDDILACLKSVDKAGIRDFSIALGPSTDGTNQMIEHFMKTHPWATVTINPVPATVPQEFGFDDARNASYDPIAAEFDWALWIDCDEVLVGEPRKFLRENHFDSLAICQHHFSCEPRGAPAQVDRPARLIRPRAGFRFIGKIHEHAEIQMNKGPGHSMILPDTDIFHKGYKNEMVRRRRFERNLPFLVWDLEVNPERKLSKYLWLRDLVHQMRYARDAGRREEAAEFAEKAILHYNEFWQDMLHFGSGLVQGFQYVSEARQFLGRGAQVSNTVTLTGGRSVTLQGMVEDPNEMTRLVDHILADECKRSRSPYR